jgi:hypothetical protein
VAGGGETRVARRAVIKSALLNAATRERFERTRGLALVVRIAKFKIHVERVKDETR